MEPRIQYTQTKDGVNIAYWTMGGGTPLVYMPIPPFSHIQLEWEIPECRRWYERLAEKHLLVRFDGRGTGLSDREASDYSLGAQTLDLEAVVEHLALERFALLAPSHSGPIGINYSASNPTRVSHLILWCSIARGSDYYQSTQVEARLELMEKDWDLYTETTAHALFGWSLGEPARQIAELIRQSITQSVLRAEILASRQFDATNLLSEVKASTLVLHRRGFSVLDLSVPKGLASRIPDARLAFLEGSSLAPYLDDSAAVLGAINEFLDDGAELAAPKEPQAASGGMVSILFTDMEGSTALAQRLGDVAAQNVRRAHNEIVRDRLGDHDGSEIKHTGDGIMASFSTASSALACAIAIQRGVAAHVAEHPDSPLSVYIGLNAGEPIAEDDDLFGTSVDLAARICDRAQAGEILASDVVRQLAAGKGFLFGDIGEVVPKGFEEPVRLYEVRWQEQG